MVRDDTRPVDLPTNALSDDYEADGDPNSVLSQALATPYEEPSVTPQKNNTRRTEVMRTEKDGSDLSLRVDFVCLVEPDHRLHSLASSSTEDEVVEPQIRGWRFQHGERCEGY